MQLLINNEHLLIMTYRMFITRCFLLLTSFLLSFQFAFSQEVGSSGAKTINGVDLKSEKKNSVSVNGKQVEKNNGTNPVPFATCGDMGAENGWSTWQSSEGYHQLGTNGDLPIFFAPGAPATMAPRFAITSGAGNDACSVGAGPLVPVVAPGFGNSSI